jgi:branched-chain amino acid transport system permease protein
MLSRALLKSGRPLLQAGNRSSTLGGIAIIVAPILLLAVVASFFLADSAELTTTRFLIYVLAVVGLGLFWGNSGILSLGHVAFVALGAYISAILTLDPFIKETELPALPAFLETAQLSLFPATLITVAIVALIAVVLGLPLLRLTGAAFVIASFGMLVIVYVILNGAREYTRGAQALFGLSGEVSIWTALGWAVLMIAVARVYRDSAAGLQLRASREDDLAARASGVNVEVRRMQAWVLSAMPMAVCGVLLGQFLSAFSPQVFYINLTVTVIAMVIVGGLTLVSGAVAGTALVTLLIELLGRADNGFSLGFAHFPAVVGLTQIGLGVMILLTLYVRRDGLMGTLEPDERARGRRGKFPAAPDTREPVSKPEITADSGLAVQNITKRFVGVQALSDVSLKVHPGEIVGLIGPNGSGKTTLLNTMSGTFPPTGGAVGLDGRDVTGQRPHSLARAGVGRTFQNIRLFSRLTVLENVRVALARGRTFGGGSAADAWELLAEFELADYAYRPAGTLAYGLQRRLEIARAMALRPTYLLLDEPAAGMNENEADALRETLVAVRQKYGVGILIVDHVLRVIMQVSDRVYVLNEGRVIAEGTPVEIQSNPTVIDAYLGHRSPSADLSHSGTEDA